jgi:quercetin dioxygenase-like cupin family protein
MVIGGDGMNAMDQKRRSLLFGLGALGVGQVLPQEILAAQAAARQGYALGATEGEHLIHFRDGGNIFIKVGSATGSDNLAMGTQQVMAGTGIPIHRHFQMDEAFHVLEGSGVFTLNDVAHPFARGASIFIPKNSWHGFSNPDQELLLLWVTTPAGLDGFFRETCSPPGVPPKGLTREQTREIARKKYATEFR